jgi:diadenosine tetraphosphatase ApaH/serine/threonine PP2A family protein phosphatase
VKVAALYDVHGMPWALEAALADVGDVDVVVFGGDLLGGPFPERAIAIARSLDARFVRGNGEREPTAWDRARVPPDELEWLAALPLAVAVDGVRYCHAAPDDDEAITTVFTPDDMLLERFGSGNVVIGHTHHQFDRSVGGLRVVNAGSVGMPYEGEVAAFWALLVDGEPCFRSTPFDVERAIAETAASGWPAAEEFVAENLRTAVTREEALAELDRRER